MKIRASRQFRYRVINFVAGEASPAKSKVLRAGIFLTLLVLLVPPGVSREIAYGNPAARPDLKSSLRMMLWLWNRSWVPLRHPLVTYYDIGWVLSEDSCQLLSERGFLNSDSLKRRCDLAQYALSSLRAAVVNEDATRIALADEKITTLVGEVLTAAQEWASRDGHGEFVSSPSMLESETSSDPPAGEFDNHATRSALLEFDKLCRDLGQEYFLVSGTFLGVVRDGGFIGHDNDIDLGVFEDRLLPGFLPALQASPHFVVAKVDRICRRVVEGQTAHYFFMEAPAVIKVVHRSGVAIDVFNHFDDEGLAWHGTSYHRWDNRRFELKDYEFLGRGFKGAVDYDLYLTENYGADWRTPRVDFDSSVDTPNLSFVGSANGLVFFAWSIARFVAEGQVVQVQKYLDMLCRLGACRLEGGQIRVV
jgi:hypothetical protein